MRTTTVVVVLVDGGHPYIYILYQRHTAPGLGEVGLRDECHRVLKEDESRIVGRWGSSSIVHGATVM